MPKRIDQAYAAELRAAAERAIAELDGLHLAGRKRLVEPQFTLGAITSGLGIPEVTVRNWLTRKQIALDGANVHAKGKWRLFSIRDAIVLSVCFNLSRLGVPVSVFSVVYESAVEFAKAMLSGPMAMVRKPIGILYNDGEWHLSKSFDTGPYRATDASPTAMSILIDYEKIVIGTMSALGMEVRYGTADELRKRVDESGEA